MNFLKTFSATTTLLLGLGFGYLYRNMPSQWSLSHATHAPIVRQNGYPIVRKSIERVKAQTVLISSEDFDGTYRGTGVLIDSMTVLTCYHMVKSYQDDIWIFVYPGKRVVKALLKLEEPVQIAHYAVFNTTTTQGEPITVIGNIQGAMRWFVSYGIVSTYDRGFIITDALIHGGNSGGPWMNDRGEIVAITDWALQDNGKDMGINGGIAASDIVRFINAYRHPVNLFELLFGTVKSTGTVRSK